MDSIDQQLLTVLQKGIPLQEHPFLTIANTLSISEDDCINRIKQLKSDRIIRQISAIFDTKSLGYKGTLAAMKFPAEKIEEAAQIINEHPGVSHNYERNHEMNLWFTMAVSSQSSLEKHIGALEKMTKAEKVLILPTLKLFKIGVSLDLTGTREATDQTQTEYYSEENQSKEPVSLTDTEKTVIKEIQIDTPLEPAPFQTMAAHANLSTAEFLQKIKNFQERGIMKRFAAVLRHREAGYSANIMGVWKAPEDRIEECGTLMASYSAVSHCYHRPTFSGWDYSLFTMIHGTSIEACESVLKEIAEKTGITDYGKLMSSREFKKVRIHYFTGEIEQWEQANIPFPSRPLLS